MGLQLDNRTLAPRRKGRAMSSLLTGLESYWLMGETGAAARADSVGANSLTASGSPSSTTGINGSGCQLVRASNTYLTKADTAALRTIFAGDFTLQLWFNLANKTNRQTLFCKYDGAADIVLIVEYSLAADRIRMWMRNAAAGDNIIDCTSLGSPSSGTWYHLVCGMSGTTQFARVNGGTKDTGAFSGTRNTTASAVYFGCRLPTNDVPDCVLDECALWSRALTDDELTDLYNSGAGKFYPTF